MNINNFKIILKKISSKYFFNQYNLKIINYNN